MNETVQHAMQNPKVAQVTGVLTGVTGGATTLDWLSTNVGLIASCVGIVVTLLLGWTSARHSHAEYKKVKLETQILEEQIRKNEMESRRPPKRP